MRFLKWFLHLLPFSQYVLIRKAAQPLTTGKTVKNEKTGKNASGTTKKGTLKEWVGPQKWKRMMRV